MSKQNIYNDFSADILHLIKMYRESLFTAEHLPEVLKKSSACLIHIRI